MYSTNKRITNISQKGSNHIDKRPTNENPIGYIYQILRPCLVPENLSEYVKERKNIYKNSKLFLNTT